MTTATEETEGTEGMPAVTKAYAGVLEAWSDANDRANEADRERRRLRKLVDMLPVGAYDGWVKTLGEPARIVDLDKVREQLAEHGLEVPMKDGNPPLQVSNTQA